MQQSVIMRISCACLLLLAATVSSQNEHFIKFKNRHIIGSMEVNSCDQVIGDKGIDKTDSNRCKMEHTFILANTDQVNNVCRLAGVPYGSYTLSLQRFDIVVCTPKNQEARRPHCQYRGQSFNRNIAFRCEEGFPVHYGRDSIVY
ncbi:hypothetical protein JOQ06_022254 [Pogonophryne albipinna]|uniref:Ribonuclease A-domain domain-containing protein n=1 Tax=Pogonophryne albipinna TaxID=1090488 RepID=A0AAD6A6A7_9TELE|nr:hypothetical protein JOQ06_022254 [Pogonophryne albipinna]